MAKKKTTKKTKPKSSGSKAASKKVVKKTTKKTVKKTAPKKKSSAKAASKKTTKKPEAKKTTTKKSSKKTTKKTSKSSAAASSKKTTKKSPAKAASAEKAGTKNGTVTTTKDSSPKSASAGKETVDPKTGRKGITVVDKKPMRRPRTQPKLKLPDNIGGSLLSTMKKGPLIQSGPNAPRSKYSALPGEDDGAAQKVSNRKSGLKAADLKSFKQILIEKRNELIGDVSELERGALQVVDSDRGAFDVAEQGSDAYDQSLSLGLAAVDRKLIREIDDALLRIENGTYGVCEMTGEPIKITRLRELPWTRYSIEGARLAEGGGQR